MPKPDYAGARAWAKIHTEKLKPRMAELKQASYETEEILIELGDEETGYDVSGVAASALLSKSKTVPHAFDAMRRIIAANRLLGRPIPESWKEFERQNTLGELKRPSKRGRPREGVRDLIYALMAQHLNEEFGLTLGHDKATPDDPNAPSASKVIHDAMRESRLHPPDPNSINDILEKFTKDTGE